jgi:hypothetical protein
MRVIPGMQGTYWDNTQEDGGDTGLGSSPQQSAQGIQIKIKCPRIQLQLLQKP